MTDSVGVSVYRVTVRGKFADLTDSAYQRLTAAADEHTYFKSGYTPEGTFVYDADVKFFSLRYEVRIDADSDDDPADVATNEAETFMKTLGYGYTNLRSAVVDMATMWPTSKS